MTVGADRSWDEVAAAMRLAARGPRVAPKWTGFRGVRKVPSGDNVNPTALQVAELAFECLTGRCRHRDCFRFEVSTAHFIVTQQ